MALSLQIVTPFLPERLKLYARKIHCAKCTEVITYISFLLLGILLSLLLYFVFISQIHFVYIIVAGIGIAFILSYSFLTFAFVFLMKFFTDRNQSTSMKYIFIKLIFILIIYIALVSIHIINYILQQKFFWLATTLILYLKLVLYFLLSIIVVSLNHSIGVWCCKCCSRKSSNQAPLLPVNVTEGQQTNPISVWDHRNVPSYTATNLPYDMSDCRSDYEQLA